MPRRKASSDESVQVITIQDHLYRKQLRGPNHVGDCKRCEKQVLWRRDRLLNHLIVCSALTQNQRTRYQQLKRTRKITKHQEFLSKNPPPKTHSSQKPKDPKPEGNTLPTKVVDQSSSRNLNSAIGDWLFRTAIPFQQVTGSLEWKSLFGTLHPSFEPPTAELIQTTILQDAFERMSKEVDSILDATSNVSLISDGWANPRGDHCVVFIVVSPLSKPVLFRSISLDMFQHLTAEVIAQEILKVIEAVGPHKITNLLTDYTPHMQNVWGIIQRTYPLMFCNACPSTVTRFIQWKIRMMGPFNETLDAALLVSKFVHSRTDLMTKYRNCESSRTLSHPWYSNWTSYYDFAWNLFHSESTMRDMGVFLCSTETCASDAMARFVNTVQSETFWMSLGRVVQVLEPVAVLEKRFDHEHGLSAPVESMFGYFQTLRACDEFKKRGPLRSMVHEVWRSIQTDSMHYAVLLDPSNRNVAGTLGGRAFVDSLHRKLEMYFSLYANQAGVNLNALCTEYRDFVAHTRTNSSSSTVYSKLFEKANFSALLDYWVTHGTAKFPILASLANRLLCAPLSSHPMHRTAKIFEFIHKRTRGLCWEQKSKLAFLYANSALCAQHKLGPQSADRTSIIDYIDETIVAQRTLC